MSGAKVAFIVHTEPLAFQQGEQCAKHLPHYRTKVITGRVQREKKHYLKDYIDRVYFQEFHVVCGV